MIKKKQFKVCDFIVWVADGYLGIYFKTLRWRKLLKHCDLGLSQHTIMIIYIIP